MPESYGLDLTGVRDSVTLYVWAYGEKWEVKEYRGIFLYEHRGYQISVKKVAGHRRYSGNIMTDGGIVAESGGTWDGETMDEKLNESWEKYIKNVRQDKEE
jgi:hypothetical protein